MATSLGENKRCIPIYILQGWICAMFEEDLYHLELSLASGKHQGSPPFYSIDSVGIRLPIQEQFHSPREGSAGGVHEGCPSRAVAKIDLGSCNARESSPPDMIRPL